jgi:2-oxoglutarate dehydrogenase E2 component (dihydrolipoamide succinyltransferase)
MMTATLDIHAPADQTEGTRSQVLRWLKAVGDTVTQHEPLIELETDKVTVEVPAPASGVLREIVKAEQEEIAPGDVLGRLETAADEADSGDRGDHGGGSGGGDSEDGSTNSAQPKHRDAEGRGAPLSAAAAQADPPRESGALQRLSPAVSRLLSERGINPSAIRGTGEGGRITVDDVLAHESSASADQASTNVLSPSNSSTKQKSNAPSAPGNPRAQSTTSSHSVPHTAIRKRIADHMVQSLLQTAPHVTTVFEADLSAVMAHRSAHRADFQERGVPLTYTAYFLAAIVQAIQSVPEANSRWSDTALEIYDDIHIGVATAVEGVGLIVPVVRNVESLDLFGIASRLDQLVTAAREGHLEPADVRGGTFTISNHGVSGSLLATPIVINQPQSAILGVGKVEKRAVIVESGDEEKIVVRPKCYVTLTIDHRVMDGHQANRFLQTFVRTLEMWPREVA